MSFYGVMYVAVVANLTSHGDSFDVKSPAREYLTKKKKIKYLNKF